MDEFDHALMEALNESVPPADISTDLADRLVVSTRRRTRLWKLLLALGLFSAATAAVVTATVLSTGTTDVASVDPLPAGTTDVSSVEVAPSSPAEKLETTDYQPTGDTPVQNTILKKAAALTGALALAAAQPSAAADGYQFIVSGYPAANPCQSDVSGGTSLDVGTLADVSVAGALEARARTSDDSASSSLRSDAYQAMVIIIK